MAESEDKGAAAEPAQPLQPGPVEVPEELAREGLTPAEIAEELAGQRDGFVPTPSHRRVKYAPTIPSYQLTPAEVQERDRKMAVRRALWRRERWGDDGALGLLEQSWGGRHELLRVLQAAPGVLRKTKEHALLKMLVNPALADRNIGELAQRAGLGVGAVLALVNNARMALAHAQALQRVAEGLPEVVSSLLQRAQGKVECSGCSGSGEVRGDPDEPVQVCGTCKGGGWVAVPPDPRAWEMALQMSGLLKGGAGVSVSVTQNTQQGVVVQGAGASSGLDQAMARFVAASDARLFGGEKREERGRARDAGGEGGGERGNE